MQCVNSHKLFILAVAFLTSAFVPIAYSGELTVNLRDQNADPVPDAVIMLYPEDGQTISNDAPYPAVMSQRNMEFIPHVLPVYMGTSVNFPNQDETRHHVYSFSAAKNFELRLYDGDTQRSVEFDSPGAVVLGCNIHDDMLGYIYVTDTTTFLKSDTQGQAKFNGLPAGNYRMRTWHPRLRGEIEQTEQIISLDEEGTVEASSELRLSRERRSSGRY